MLVNEKIRPNAFLGYPYNGTGNYIASQRPNNSLAVTQLEQTAFPVLYENLNGLTPHTEENREPVYVVHNENEVRSDLPLSSDLLSSVDYDTPPASLRFARLDIALKNPRTAA